MDWAKAKYVDRLLNSLWLRPDTVRTRYDLRKIASAQRPVSAQLLSDWQQVAPGSDAAVIAFDFRVTGTQSGSWFAPKLKRPVVWAQGRPDVPLLPLA